MALLAVTAGSIGCAPPASVEARGEWPQFRGPNGLAVAPEGGPQLPVEWHAESPNMRWRTPLDTIGNSAPVVYDGQIFLTAVDPLPEEARDAEPPLELRRWVLAFDLASGSPLWRTEIFRSPFEQGHPLNTNAAPTPVTDGRHLWVWFGSIAAKLDLEGNIVWSRRVDPDYTKWIRYGVASSPMLASGSLILFQDREWAETDDIGWMAAIDPATGEDRWRIHWKHTCCAYSTPVVWHRQGRDELIVAQSGELVAYDPATGERLWDYQHPMLQVVSSPVIAGDDLICAPGGAHNNKGNLCLAVRNGDDGIEVEELWWNHRVAPESSSSVLYRGRLYTVTEAGIVACWQPRTGEQLWYGRLRQGKGYRASLVAGDGKVYAYSTWGVTAVIDAEADQLEVLAYSQLPEGGNNATPAIAGDCLLLRSYDHLYCLAAEA